MFAHGRVGSAVTNSPKTRLPSSGSGSPNGEFVTGLCRWGRQVAEPGRAEGGHGAEGIEGEVGTDGSRSAHGHHGLL